MPRDRLQLWPIRLKIRKKFWYWFLCDKVHTGNCRNGGRIFGWFVTFGPVKLVVGKPLGG
jgi:hypothetical protein